MKKVAVLQSNYIPWKGYFDIIHDVDEFIFYDEVQYTTRDWRNRNIIIQNGKTQWLTVPVGADTTRSIVDVIISDSKWQSKHYASLKHSYGKSKFFKKYEEFFHNVYLEREWDYLYKINRYLIEYISHDFLGIKTKFTDSRDYQTHGVKHEKLLSLVKAVGATTYVSGPAAKDYIITEDYEKAGIEIIWKDYSGYPEYHQNSEKFTHNVSILDLLFNVGDEAPYYIWKWRNDNVSTTLGGGVCDLKIPYIRYPTYLFAA